jgi:hypothetical protein
VSIFKGSRITTTRHLAFSILTALLVVEVSMAAGPTLNRVSAVRTGALTDQPIEVESATGQMFLVSLVGSAASSGHFTLQVHGEGGRLPSLGGPLPLNNPRRRAGLVTAYFDRSERLFAVIQTHIEGGQSELLLQQVTRNNVSPITTALSPQVLATGFRALEFLGRTSTNSRGLLAITQTNFGSGDFYDRRVKIVDESTGATVSLAASSMGGTLELYKTATGSAKVLSTGPEGFKVMDVASGVVMDVLGRADSHALFDLQTPNGPERAVISTTGARVEMRKIVDVLQNIYSPAVALPSGTKPNTSALFSVGQRFGFTINEENTVARIVDLLNGQLVGVPLVVPSHGGLPSQENFHSVSHVFEDRGQLVAVLDRPTQPRSFFNGNTLTYMNVSTGQVLRTREEINARILPTIFIARDGRTLVVEREQYFWSEGGGVRIVDALSNQLVVNHGDLEAMSFPFLSESGENILLTVQVNPNFPDGIVCVLSLESAERSCISDPSVSGLVRYHQGMITVRDGLISLPLIHVQAGGLGYISGVARYHIK